jgi:hypothetical protein
MNYCELADSVLASMCVEQPKELCSRKPPILIVTAGCDVADLAVAEPSELVTAAFKHAGRFMIGFMVEIEEESNAGTNSVRLDLVAHRYGVARNNGVIEEITPGKQVN